MNDLVEETFEIWKHIKDQTSPLYSYYDYSWSSPQIKNCRNMVLTIKTGWYRSNNNQHQSRRWLPSHRPSRLPLARQYIPVIHLCTPSFISIGTIQGLKRGRRPLSSAVPPNPAPYILCPDFNFVLSEPFVLWRRGIDKERYTHLKLIVSLGPERVEKVRVTESSPKNRRIT